MGKRVEVYWNLHKDLFSVRNMQTGRVMMHTHFVRLQDAKFVVRPSGRLRVLREKRKNVHAFVRGYLDTYDLDWSVYEPDRKATYNPYKYDCFVDSITEQKLDNLYSTLLIKDAASGKPSIFYNQTNV
jgi:hypothetical protein